MLYMVTFTINISQILASMYIYIPYMDPMGICIYIYTHNILDYNNWIVADKNNG